MAPSVLSPVKGHTAKAPPPPPPVDTDLVAEDAPLPPPTPPGDDEFNKKDLVADDDFMHEGLEGPPLGLGDMFDDEVTETPPPEHEEAPIVAGLDGPEPAIAQPSAIDEQPLPDDVEEEISVGSPDEPWQEPESPLVSAMNTFYRDEFRDTGGGLEGWQPGGSSSSGGGGQGLAAVLEAVAKRPAAPPPTPFLPHGLKTPKEAYALEERRASTPFQRAALEQLKEWDEEVEGRFSAKQALNLSRLLSARKHKPPEPKERSWAEVVTCSGAVGTWIALLALVMLVPLGVAGYLSRDMNIQEPGGALVRTVDGSPVAAASLQLERRFSELSELPEAELRQIRACSFVHRGSFHRLSVASMVRSAAGSVQLASADGSNLKLVGAEGSLALTFIRPFKGDEQVDLREPFNTQSAGCSFVVRRNAKSRSRPKL